MDNTRKSESTQREESQRLTADSFPASHRSHKLDVERQILACERMVCVEGDILIGYLSHGARATSPSFVAKLKHIALGRGHSGAGADLWPTTMTISSW